MVEEAAWTGGVDQETSGEPNTPSSSLAFDHDASLPGFDSRDRRLVEILDPRRLRLADEKVIEVGAIPVRVGDFIVGLAATRSWSRRSGSPAKGVLVRWP